MELKQIGEGLHFQAQYAIPWRFVKWSEESVQQAKAPRTAGQSRLCASEKSRAHFVFIPKQTRLLNKDDSVAKNSVEYHESQFSFWISSLSFSPSPQCWPAAQCLQPSVALRHFSLFWHRGCSPHSSRPEAAGPRKCRRLPLVIICHFYVLACTKTYLHNGDHACRGYRRTVWLIYVCIAFRFPPLHRE